MSKYPLNEINIKTLRSQCVEEIPFKHAVLDDLWDAEFLKRVAEETKDLKNWDGEKDFFGSQRKRYLADWRKMGPYQREILAILSQNEIIELASKLMEIDRLIPDPNLEGGGIHSTTNGGFLELHTDFNWSGKLRLVRRVNILVYLNKEWQDSWGGQLELTNPDFSNSKKILPTFNRTVIFVTDEKTYHGQPRRVCTPDGRSRDSIAAYYYTAPTLINQLTRKRIGTTYLLETENQARQIGMIAKVKNKVREVFKK